jgi:hypothetical protein
MSNVIRHPKALRRATRVYAPLETIVRIRELRMGGILREVSAGGFSIEVSERLSLNAIYTVVVMFPDGDTVRVCGRVMHCSMEGTDPHLPFIAGFAFTHEREADEQELLKRVTPNDAKARPVRL